MTKIKTQSERPTATGNPRKKRLSPEAQRALAEAEERRRTAEAETRARPKEVGGRKGPDPIRYGDWEKKGIASDF
jgi:hypothetical protein